MSHIFISYSRQNLDLAMQIVKLLEESGRRVWIDQADIIAGERWENAILEGIQECALLIVIVSNVSIRSEWVTRETMMALDLEKPVLPILIEDTELPDYLSNILALDIRDGLTDESTLKLRQSINHLVGESSRVKTPTKDEEDVIPDKHNRGWLESLKLRIAQFLIRLLDMSNIAQPPYMGRFESFKLTVALLITRILDVPVTAQPPANIEVPMTLGQDTIDGLRFLNVVVSDHSSISDHLGYDVYTGALAGFILNPETTKPLTIAIDGEWGMGKTTLMKQLEATLLDRSVSERPLTVWFNAWKYQREEALWAALALSTTQQIAYQLSLPRRIWVKFRMSRAGSYNYYGFTLAILWGLLRIILLTIIGAIIAFSAALLAGIPLENAVNEVAKLALAGGTFIPLMQFASQMLKQSFNLLNIDTADYMNGTPDFAQRIGFIGTFDTHFNKLVRLVSNNGKRPLVIFIDDLDRLVPSRMGEIVEAINLFLDSQYCVFILGMDMNTVGIGIESNYKNVSELLTNKGQRLGRLYLEKIVQLVFPIPVPNKADLQKYIKHSLGQKDSDALDDPGKFKRLQIVQEIVANMSPYLEHNPRRIKRFINVFRLQVIIAREQGYIKYDSQLNDLGVWLELAVRWRQFVKDIILNPDLDDQLVEIVSLQRREGELTIDEQKILDAYYPVIGQKKDYLDDQELMVRLEKVTTQFDDEEIRTVVLPVLQITTSVYGSL